MPAAYQLRIELRDFKPSIYRDVLVDPATTLPKLHQLIQAAMGWEDAHMHGFAVPLKNERYQRVQASRRFEKPSADGWGEPANNEARFKLQDVMATPKDCGGLPGAAYWARVWHDTSHPERDIAFQMFGENVPSGTCNARMESHMIAHTLLDRNGAIHSYCFHRGAAKVVAGADSGR